MTSVYLDTNAASYLFERRGWSVDRLSALRRTLARACDSGRVALVTSMGLAEELVGIRRIDRARFVRTVKFVYDLAGWRILLPLPKRIEGEVVARTKLSGRAPFLRSDMRKRFRQSLMNPDFTQEVDSAVRSEMAAFLANQTARRGEVRTRLGPKWAAHTRGWWGEAVLLVDQWTYNDLRASRDALALPEDESLWPAPAEVPSAWHAKAFQMARIALTVGENRRIRGSDLWDAIHYADAIYADVMVTDDTGFLETYSAIPGRPFIVETFEEFTRRRLGVG